MDATHYWPFAREYSIWNAAVAALQFWMAGLEPQTLSDAIEWVYTAFFCSTSAQQLRSISEEVLFSHFMTTLNDAFEWECAQKMKVTTAGVKAWIFPLLYVEHHAYIMYQQLKTCLSDLLHHLHIEHTHLINAAASAVYAATCYLAMMTAHQQIPVNSIIDQDILHL